MDLRSSFRTTRCLVSGVLTGLLLSVPAWAAPLGYQSWSTTAAPPSLSLTAATWEDSPAGSESQSLGDDRLRELKVNIRLRANTEQCWVSSGCAVLGTTDNSGRSKLGSARPFFQNSAPTGLVNLDALGVGTLDNGRLWLDLDGASGATTDDSYFLWTYNVASAAWKPVLAMGVDGTANNDIKAWNSANATWQNMGMHTSTVDIATNTTADVAISVQPAGPDAVTLTGGGGTGGNPRAVVPASGSYLIHVTGHMEISHNANSITYVGLKEDDGGGAVVVDVCKGGPYTSGGAVQGFSCSFDYYKDAPTLGATYTYSLEVQTSNAGTIVFNPDSGGYATAGTANTRTRLQVELRAKPVPKGF